MSSGRFRHGASRPTDRKDDQGLINLPLPPTTPPSFSYRPPRTSWFVGQQDAPEVDADDTVTGSLFRGGSATAPRGTGALSMGWGAVLGAGILFLLAVTALIILLILNQRIISAIGPVGPQGPPGEVLLNSSNLSSPFSVENLTVTEYLHFGPFNEPSNATVYYNDTLECLVVEPALCVNNLTIHQTLVLDEGVTIEGGTLAIDILFLPLSLDHGDNSSLSTLSSAPHPDSNITMPLLCLDTPGGFCLTDDLFFNQTLYGTFTAPDCPNLNGGLDVGGNGFLKPTGNNLTLEATDDLFLCTNGGLGTAHLNVGCSPRGPVELGEVQTVLELADDVCLTWDGMANPQEGMCYNASASCVTMNMDCLVFDGTVVSFKNGAYVEGDLFVSGNLTYTNMNQMNISQVNGSLTVTECVLADCVVTNNLTVSTDVSIQTGSTVNVQSGVSWTQIGAGTWNQFSVANLNSLTNVNGNLFVNSGATLSINGGADLFMNGGGELHLQSGSKGYVKNGASLEVLNGGNITVKTGGDIAIQAGGEMHFLNGSQFTSDASATAACATPLFTPLSGCVDTCPNFSTCNMTVKNQTVTNTLKVNHLVCTGTVTGCGTGGGGTLTDVWNTMPIPSLIVPHASPLLWSTLGSPATLGTIYTGLGYVVPNNGVYMVEVSLTFGIVPVSYLDLGIEANLIPSGRNAVICHISSNLVITKSLLSPASMICSWTTYLPAGEEIQLRMLSVQNPPPAPITTSSTFVNGINHYVQISRYS